MENREFIAANELPEIEAETVDVLCVDPETGEMGKKSGAALGGGGGYILKPTVEETVRVNESVFVITADCADMVKALETGANVIVVIPANVVVEDAPPISFVIAGWLIEDGALNGMIPGGIAVFPNAPFPSFLQE